MWGSRRLERRASVLDVVDGVFFAYSAVAATWFGYVLLRDGVRPGWPSLLLVVFWVFFSYLALPRLHRVLTHIYVPDYFIGRARTSDGLLGDPVNLGLIGSETQVHQAFARSGWTRAHDLDLASGRRIVTSTLRRRSYPEAPVSPLALFDRQQDFAYQQEVAGSPSRRHHVRFWRCPEGWLLPGGFAVDWLAAGTYDRGVGLSLFTLQVTHKIEGDTDVERDFIVQSVSHAVPEISIGVIEDFSTGYHSRNGGGDRIETDGDLPMLDLRGVVAPDAAATEPTDSTARRPAQTVFGAAVGVLHGLLLLGFGLLLVVAPNEAARLADTGAAQDDVRSAALILLGPVVLFGIVDIGLALAVLAGHNWARLWLMCASALTTATAFLATVGPSGTPVGLARLPSIGSGILVLLALSSHRARAYAVAGRSRRRPGSGEKTVTATHLTDPDAAPAPRPGRPHR